MNLQEAESKEMAARGLGPEQDVNDALGGDLEGVGILLESGVLRAALLVLGSQRLEHAPGLRQGDSFQVDVVAAP
jgi:hypothetical protein